MMRRPLSTADTRGRVAVLLGRVGSRVLTGVPLAPRPLAATLLVEGSRVLFFFSSRRRHTRSLCDWSSDVCSSDLSLPSDLPPAVIGGICLRFRALPAPAQHVLGAAAALDQRLSVERLARATVLDRAIVEGVLDLLEWNRWLVADARGYVFAAPIERAVLLQEMVTPGQARRYRENLTT